MISYGGKPDLKERFKGRKIEVIDSLKDPNPLEAMVITGSRWAGVV